VIGEKVCIQRMDNGRGENEFMEMMGLKEKMFPREKMCP
jgi:hypothetical protein